MLVPGKYNVDTGFANFTVFVSIFASDGTVGIAHGGVEVGQGINVKVSYEGNKVCLNSAACSLMDTPAFAHALDGPTNLFFLSQ